MTIDLTDPAWREDAAERITAWLQAQQQLEIDDAFGYESPYYETTMSDLVTHACGYSNDPDLFVFPDGLRGEFDLVADTEGTIGFVRHLLATPFDGPLGGRMLATVAHDLKNSTDDRSATGIDAAVAVLLNAAGEYAALLRLWNDSLKPASGS